MPRDTAALTRAKLEQLAKDPHAQRSNVTKLQGRSGYRLGDGDWRAIYEVCDDRLLILVLKIATRGEVYR